MAKWLSRSLTAMLLILMLAACGGGDDDDDADPTATVSTEATAAATATTQPAGGETAASPTPAPTEDADAASPTAAGTAPSRPIVTPTPSEAPASPTAIEGTGYSRLETEMLAALIQPEDLTGDWTQETFGLMDEDTDDSDEICGQPSFPDRDLKLAGVEVEYELDADIPAFLIENIVIFPAETAVEAVAYAREMSSCGEWTDGEGTTYTVTPLDAEAYGDESYTFALEYVVSGTAIYGEYTFIRVGGAIATVAFITLQDEDVTEYRSMVGVAADRLAESGLGDASAGAELDSLLLVADDMAQIDDVNVWTAGNAIDPTDEERFAVCEAGSFPDVLGAVTEAGHELAGNDNTGPFAMHSVVQMLDGDGPAAMDWIRTELSCGSWSDDDGEYEVTETGDLDVGDGSYWLIVTATTPGDATQTFQIGYSFTQISDYVSVVGLAAEGSIDPELFGAMTALGAQKVFAGTP